MRDSLQNLSTAKPRLLVGHFGWQNQIESKATRKNYYILKSKIVEKIRGEALKSGRIPLLAIRCSLGDFILFRVYDFFTEVTETSLKCSSSLKITQDIFEGLFEGFREIDVNGNVWGLIRLTDFQFYIDGGTDEDKRKLKKY